MYVCMCVRVCVCVCAHLGVLPSMAQSRGVWPEESLVARSCIAPLASNIQRRTLKGDINIIY